MLKGVLKNKLVIYLVKFLGAFLFLFYGTEALIGITAPGGYYNGFIDQNLNYVDWLRSSLMWATAKLVSVFGYHPVLKNELVLRLEEGGAFRMVYSCLGYGVMSFWTAFIFANNGTWKNKTVWIAGGLLMLWCINVLRLSIVLVGSHYKWGTPLGWDHHTWFTICAYILIFSMIYLYDKSSKNKLRYIQ